MFNEDEQEQEIDFDGSDVNDDEDADDYEEVREASERLTLEELYGYDSKEQNEEAIYDDWLKIVEGRVRGLGD